jgi:uncharacterized protein (DUF305 family)
MGRTKIATFAAGGLLAGVLLVGGIGVAAARTPAGPGDGHAIGHGPGVMHGAGGHGGMGGEHTGGPAGSPRHGPTSGPGTGGHGVQGPGMGSMQVESEFDYLTQMIPHHEEAIVSARLLLQGTDRPEMRAFAESIIQTQSAEVARMREYLRTWYPGRETEVSYQPMMRDLSRLTGDELDRAFLKDMIPHHMMAVMMSQQALGRGLTEHPEVASLATGIRDAQHQEIATMAGWLASWFGERPVGNMGHGAMRGHSGQNPTAGGHHAPGEAPGAGAVAPGARWQAEPGVTATGAIA